MFGLFIGPPKFHQPKAGLGKARNMVTSEINMDSERTN
jgi:hypothetical protein